MSIKIIGLDKLQKKFKTIEDFNKWANKPMSQSLDLLYKETQNQPRKSPGAFTALATPGQRRAYWAKVASGEAKHSESSGYVRSHKLKSGWKRRIQNLAGGMRGTIDNKTPYGTYVQGRARQPFHNASGWKTDTEIEEKNIKKIADIWRGAVRRLLNS